MSDPIPRLSERIASAAKSAPLSAAVLVIANALPLFGVLFWDWDVGLILIAYWLENGVVGLLTIPKIVLAMRSPGLASTPLQIRAGYAALIFFPFHYGLIWLIHGLFVIFLAGMATRGGFGMFSPFFIGGGYLGDPQVVLVAAALLFSHATSFLVNYVGRDEYLRTKPVVEAVKPYVRVVVLQFTVVLGAFALVLVGQPAALVALLVIFKTIVDLALHLREHRRAAPAVTV